MLFNLSPFKSSDFTAANITAEASQCKVKAVPSFLQGSPEPLDESQIERLMAQGYTRGLSMSLNEMRNVFALRIWIVDNSNSMKSRDGHKIISYPNSTTIHATTGNNIQMAPCSRWEEIVECVQYHIDLATLIEAPTRFRLLNAPSINDDIKRKGSYPQFFSVAENRSTLYADAASAKDILNNTQPVGCTPLTWHVRQVQTEVSSMASELNALGKKVAIIIATDGLPTDIHGHGGSRQVRQEFVEALRSLEGLPVWVVIRLCTDEEDVVDFYNELDGQLELSLEVLDDFVGEAKEVIGENKWLNYALPLHRLREMGYHDRVFDMLDERPLTKTELRDFCGLLFGRDDFDGVPDPSLDWKGFLDCVETFLQKETLQFDPIKRKLRPWINTKKLNRIHRPYNGCIIS